MKTHIYTHIYTSEDLLNLAPKTFIAPITFKMCLVTCVKPKNWTV